MIFLEENRESVNEIDAGHHDTCAKGHLTLMTSPIFNNYIKSVYCFYLFLFCFVKLQLELLRFHDEDIFSASLS